MSQDKCREIMHDKLIKEDAEFFWGWATPAGKLRAQRRACMIIDEIKDRGFLKILEIGSGTGVFTEFFCKAGLDVSAIDISFEMLDKARARCLNIARAHISAADTENLPFHDETFDAVVGICVLHHLDLIPTLKEIKRTLKKGGIILFSEPNMMNPQLMLQKNVKPIKRLRILAETEDETAFFKWQMKGMLRDMAFEDIKIRPFDFLHPWTPKFFIRPVKKLGSYLENLPILRELSGSLFICATKR